MPPRLRDVSEQAASIKLAIYCETRDTLRGRRDELVARAEPLLRELEAEEALK